MSRLPALVVIVLALTSAPGVAQSRLPGDVVPDHYDLTFTVDRETHVLAVGGTRATKKAGGSQPLTDFVHAGDIVRVEYREASGAMKALEIQIRGRATVPAK